MLSWSDDFEYSDENSMVINEDSGPHVVVHPRKTSLNLSAERSQLTFHNINMDVKKKGQRKQILSSCSGIMSCGLNAILGPTGAGKSSLLSVLAGRKEKPAYTGSVFVNGYSQTEDFRLASGFVVQEDILMGTMTVRENLAFSATLRLPKHYTKKEREKRVDQTITDLGLFSCAETKVGTDESRGVSGGERRRTSIGMELITSPEFLFLDEPTTGLDASTACSVMTLLKGQCDIGRTIIFSIHQPRYSVFKQFDTITLLSQGEIVYHGKASKAIKYFGELGYPCETYNNPADHFLDIISINEKEQRDFLKLRNSGFEEANEVPSFANEYNASFQRNQIEDYIYPIVQEAKEKDRLKMDTSKFNYNSSFFKQLFYVSRRTTLNVFRNPQAFTSQIVVNVIMGCVIGAIYYNMDFTVQSGLMNRSGMIFLILSNMVFSNLSAVAVFLQDRTIFKHESASGYYRCSTYFIAKVICDVIPLRLIPILVFAAISYFLTGLQKDVVKFFIFVLTLFLTSTAAASWCLVVSSSVSRFDIANILVSLPFVVMMMFSGFLINLASVPVWLRWLQYTSLVKYGFSTLMINELEELEFTKTLNGTVTIETGLEYLDKNGIDPSWLWWNQLVLVAFTIGFLLLTYIQLRRMKKF